MTKNREKEPKVQPETAGKGSRIEEALSSKIEEEDKEKAQREMEHDFLCFRIASRNYAIRIKEVVEVVSPSAVAEIPHTPSYIKGVFNRHGRVTTLLDLANFMGTDAEDSPSRLVVLAASDLEAAIPITDIHGIVPIADDKIEPALPHLAQAGSFVVGQVMIGDNVHSILDVKTLLENSRSKKEGSIGA
jgi:purine-binding chemotaxis protein CheW